MDLMQVLTVDWHPSMALIASGGRDNTVKLWDPRAAENECLATLYGHKLDVMKVCDLICYIFLMGLHSWEWYSGCLDGFE